MFLFINKGVSTFCSDMSWFSTLEAKVVVKASLLFLWGKFFDANCIHIHGIGVSFLLGVFLGVTVAVSVVLEGKERVSSSFGDIVGLFPDMFEMCAGINCTIR